MGCPEKQAKLIEWVLKELPAGEAEDLERHVRECADCARSVADYERVQQALKDQLVQEQIPAHLVFLREKPQVAWAGFFPSLWRTAALSAAAAVLFLLVFLGGYARWAGRAASPIAAKGSLTQAEVEAIAAQVVQRQWAEERRELVAMNEKVRGEIGREQAQAFARMTGQLQLLQRAQSLVWKQTEDQKVLFQLIARNTLGQEAARPGKP